MKDYADLEIGLHRRDVDTYGIEMRFSHPASDAEVRVVRGRSSLIHVDFTRLRELALDPAAYGQLLARILLADPDVRAAFAQANSSAQATGLGLRLRLLIGPNASELHSLHWETLCDPQDGSFLLTGEHILFSRYLNSGDWQQVGVRPWANPRALVVIANPANLAKYKPLGRRLAPVDVLSELERAESSLGSIPVTSLASGGSANLPNISAHLREGYDILYLVCHGALIEGKVHRGLRPYLWLEDEAGNAKVVSGWDLVTQLKELAQRPRLVVLASCQSAGLGHADGTLAALGPRLAEEGIPAVLAMQGEISMPTMAQFMPVFFQGLRSHGRIDRAVAVARGAVRDQPDWWVPVLFMRLKSGRVWYAPGFAGDRPGLEKWPALLNHIQQRRCTPILGSGLTESLLGPRCEIARRWAETYRFPMAPHDCEDLPQVAQYLAVNQDPPFPRDELVRCLRREILRRYGSDLPQTLHNATLDELIAEIWVQKLGQDPENPHRLLSVLPLPIYVTTDFSNLLVEALTAVGKRPQVRICRWAEDVQSSDSVFDTESVYRPTVSRPLVYHLFGRLNEPDSLVLTEDDYFDFLIGVSRCKDLIPPVVRRALADTALLFLGFRMDDWSFRVLFHSIMSQEGGYRRNRYAHVAVQIDPEEGRVLEPELARRYLESYFHETDISIYWGSVKDFVRDLRRHWDGGTP